MATDDTNSLIEQRKAKLAALRAKGIDPFKNKFTPAETCAAARAHYVEGREVALAGRITAHRDMGKSMFLDIRDQSGRIQIYAQKNVLGDEQWHIFTHLDLGDFIGVRGTMFTTKTGEISVKLGGSGTGVPSVGQASRLSQIEKENSETAATAAPPFVILTKTLRPPPAKWHGLEDTEIRYRQRYLDLIGNPEVKDVFLKRSAIVHEIRQFFHSRGYVEVETPAMQAIPGGAAAQPFKTFHNALGCEFYLRIALELYHKRLLVGGIDKLFEIGKNFRNEGLSPRHNPEFTMLEAYQAFGDYESMMQLVENMVCNVAQKLLGTLVIYHPRRNSLRTRFDFAESLINENRRDSFSDGIKAHYADCLAEIDECRKLVSDFPQTEKLAWRCNGAIESLRTKLQVLDPQSYPGLQGDVALLEKIEKNIKPFTERKEINLTPPWPRRRYKDLVREVAGKDWFEVTPQERRRRAMDDLKLAGDIAKGYEDFEVTGAVFEKLIEPTINNFDPIFVTHLPKELVPLAKLSPDDPTTVEVFECCINGQEISPGYTEQNDPIAQRTTLEHQAGGEQQKLDEDFLVALEHGMPPAGGIGIGIDRLCMMLLGQESIRDVILFPQLKPK
ncbi:MAG: OB-fold nucleic acid binding domain-containing protein [Verrucomicrobia bacterium]|nr:OB-fold nucleic acid binding domain-containing protein [Verrucomicrobiota bacterium]